MVLGACLVTARAATAQYTQNDVDCSGLKLVAASGVPTGQTHGYRFHGVCNIIQISSVKETALGINYENKTSVKVLGTVWADLAASWNSQTGDFKEQAKTQGTYPGEVSMVLRCTADPVLWNGGFIGIKPPCQGLAYSNTTGWDGFDRVYAVPRPISLGKTTLSEATALSQQQAANAPSAPPPPPAPTPTSPSPTIPRVTTTTRTQPVVAVAPPIPVAPTRTVTAPAPSPPPESSGEIALAPAVRVELQDGRALVADQGEGAMRWAIIGPKGHLLRRFPPGSKLTEGPHHDLTITWAGGSYRAGKRDTDKSKEKAHHH